MIIFLIPDYHTRNLSAKRFQLRFLAHHKSLVKVNENRSIITKKSNPIFWGKNHPGLLWSRWDLSIHQGLPKWYQRGNTKTNRDETQKITDEYQYFHRGELNYVICFEEVENSNFLKKGVVLQVRFSPGNSPGPIQLWH